MVDGTDMAILSLGPMTPTSMSDWWSFCAAASFLQSRESLTVFSTFLRQLPACEALCQMQQMGSRGLRGRRALGSLGEQTVVDGNGQIFSTSHGNHKFSLLPFTTWAGTAKQ